MKTWWVEQKLIEKLVGALNSSHQESRLIFTLPLDIAAQGNEYLNGSGDAIHRGVWCGGETERVIKYQFGANDAVLGEDNIVLYYTLTGNQFALAVCPLPHGEIAFRRERAPKVRLGSNDSLVAPTQWISGLRNLLWSSLYDRLCASMSDRRVQIVESPESVDAGQIITDNHSLDSEGKTCYVKYAMTTTLQAAEVHCDAWKFSGRPTISKLLSSCTYEFLGEDAGARNIDVFRQDEACLLFGVVDKPKKEVLGLRIDFTELELYSNCEIFPPLRSSEIIAEKITVNCWPSALGEDYELQRYMGSQREMNVIKAEHGRAWTTTASDKSIVILRAIPKEATPMEVEVDDGLAQCVKEVWQTVDPVNWPMASWHPRHLLRLTARPADDSSTFAGAFFHDPSGVLLPATQGPRRLCCFGVWLRLHPNRSEEFFNPRGALRILIGNCFPGGQIPSNMFDIVMQDWDSKEMCEALEAHSSSVPMRVALPVFSAFLRNYTNHASWERVVFIPLDVVSQPEAERGDMSVNFLTLLTGQLLSILSKPGCHLVDLAPVLPYIGVESSQPYPTTRKFDLNRNEVLEAARDYYKHRPGPRLVSQLFDQSFIVWTKPMTEIAAAFENMSKTKKKQGFCELITHYEQDSGVTTALSFVQYRLQKQGFHSWLVTSIEDLDALLRRAESLLNDSELIALFLDFPEAAKCVPSVKASLKCRIFIAYERHFASRSPVQACSKVLVSPHWSHEEFDTLAQCLHRAFWNEEDANDKKGVWKALQEALEYARTERSCAHLFLLVFVGTTGGFLPLPTLIENVRDEFRSTEGSHWLSQAPLRLLDAIAFVAATCRTGMGVPYHSDVFSELLNGKWTSKVLRVVPAVGSHGPRQYITYVHPFFARIHLALATGSSTEHFEHPLPPVEAILNAWKTIGPDLKVLVSGLWYSVEDQNLFFRDIFVKPLSLSPLAQHFVSAQQGELLIQMSKPYVDEVHHCVLASKIMRHERKWAPAITNASNAKKKRSDFMTLHNYGITLAEAIKASRFRGPEELRYIDKALEAFAQALSCDDKEKGHAATVQEQIEQELGDKIRAEDALQKYTQLLPQQGPEGKRPYLQDGPSPEQWRFVQLWVDAVRHRGRLLRIGLQKYAKYKANYCFL